MNHDAANEEASQLLQTFVDGELSDAERKEVSALLERSEEARAYVRVQSEVRELLKATPRPSASPELEARIRDALRETEAAAHDGAVVSLSRWRRRALGVATTMLPAAAAAALLFVYASGEGVTNELAASAVDVTERGEAPAASSASPAASPSSTAVSAPPSARANALAPSASRIHPANLHLPAGIELVSTQPVPLPASPTARPLDLVDARDGRRFALTIRPASAGERSGEILQFEGRHFRRVETSRPGLALEFSHGDRIVTITTAVSGSSAGPAGERVLIERMLEVASALEIR